MAHIGIGAATGDDKAIEAVKMAVSSPLLETTITGASHVIINISGDISLMDANDAPAMSRIWQATTRTLSLARNTMSPLRTRRPLQSSLPGWRSRGGAEYHVRTGFQAEAGSLNISRTASGQAKPVSRTHQTVNMNSIQRPKNPTPSVQPKDIKIPDFLKNTRK